jgi:DNA-directed RNA polymerase specialized sigma24 family protein
MNMGIRLIPQRSKQMQDRYATADDFRKLFAEDMTSLHLLAFLLTGSYETAEQCFVSGIEDCAQGSSVFQQWARSWARRVIIQNAVRMIAPHPHFRDELIPESPSAVVRNERKLDQDAAWAGVLALENFERFVFVISVLEGYGDRECAALLGCAVLEVGQARMRASQQIADFGRTSIQSVNELSRMAVG